MSKTVDETHRVAKIILEHLDEGPKRWTDLEKLTIRSSPTYGRFQTTLNWLLRNNYIKKVSRGVYETTDRGKVFLKLLLS